MTPDQVGGLFDAGESFVEGTIAAALVMLWLIVLALYLARPYMTKNLHKFTLRLGADLWWIVYVAARDLLLAGHRRLAAAEARPVPFHELECHVAAHGEAREQERLALGQDVRDLLGHVVGEERHRMHGRHGAERGPAPTEVGSEDGRDRAEGARRGARRERIPDAVVERIAVKGDEMHAHLV